MTLQNLLTKVNEEKPSSFTSAKLISFVNEVELDVAEQLGIKSAPVYGDNATDKAKTLLAQAPYDRLYVSYLKAMIDYSNEEYASYQLNQEQHTLDFHDFIDWIVRTGSTKNNKFPTRFKNTL